MGYRSNIVIAVSAKILAEHLISPCIPEDLLEKEHVDIKGSRYWILEGWKWYDRYPEIREIEAFFDNLDDSDFAAIRIGEDVDDIQTWGNPSDYGIYVHTSISYPSGSV